MKRNDLIDFKDALYALERLPAGVRVLESTPAPISVWKEGQHKGKEKINPHLTRFSLSNGAVMDVFHIKPVYYLHIEGGWRPMSEVASHFGNRNVVLKDDWADKIDLRYLNWLVVRTSLFGGAVSIPSPLKVGEIIPLVEGRNVHFTTDTFYPDPDAETTSVDGYVEDDGNTTAWATLVAEPGTGAVDNGATMPAFGIEDANSGSNWRNLRRGIFLFDTSAIDNAANISATVLSLFGVSKSDPSGDTPDCNIYSSAPASNTALAAGDFDSLGSTAFATAVTYANLSTVAYVDFTFNATGIAAVSLTGVSKFGTRNANYDVAVNAPISRTGFQSTAWNVIAADTALTTTDPKLVVTYTVSSISSSPSSSISASPSTSISSSISSSPSSSISTSPSSSISPSTSISSSPSSSISSSISTSISSSISPSTSISSSLSSSISTSISTSISSSISSSPSSSISSSISSSVSSSPSPSAAVGIILGRNTDTSVGTGVGRFLLK